MSQRRRDVDRRRSPATGSSSPQQSAQQSARAHATPRTPPRASSFARSTNIRSSPKRAGYTEHRLLSGELRISEQQCAAAEAFARSYLTEAKLFGQQRRAFQDELKELRSELKELRSEREKHQAEATSIGAAVSSLQEQLTQQLVGRQSAVESARQFICKVETQEIAAARSLSDRVKAWEHEVALHVQKGITNRVDPVIFSSNAPMFERVTALIKQEKARTEERKEGLQLLMAAQARQLPRVKALIHGVTAAASRGHADRGDARRRRGRARRASRAACAGVRAAAARW